ncbi:E3 ubiquitin-protein transferase RMND5B isoform X1 [Physeter macrocephalus]|uniref:E3 ubiquitin-protein transferase RMND5B isoform X1 n=2 Tax=Physeter macrocephalus TaxID=9755 RepID=A0A2Y9FAH0_PHYMC|nr:E3 ubiquitin-protein transferase RMND5B isoform X1 [Physeter catodon]XP_054936033.1 E3 ubiquitin-protein transferase RMND5B isoform X1 [Physeter catodon]XP_054936035.1 E3 ubiquitin-protein transferase RMND5B isoform X1 [Physeter catodon]
MRTAARTPAGQRVGRSDSFHQTCRVGAGPAASGSRGSPGAAPRRSGVRFPAAALTLRATPLVRGRGSLGHPSAEPRVGESGASEQLSQVPVPLTAAPETTARAAGTDVGQGRELDPHILRGPSGSRPYLGSSSNSHVPSYCDPAEPEVGPDTVAAMEQCASVEREVDKVLQKFLTYGQHCEQSLEELLHYVGQLRAELASAALQGTSLSATLSLVMSQCCRKIKDTVQKLASDHKDIHSSVSRVGKAIDRNFDSEICGVVSDAVWDSREKQQQILQMAILEHLYQQGMLSVAEELCQESTLNVDLDFKQPFLELNRILEALHEQDLGPALEWAVSHRQRLLELNSSLEFKLHRLHFIRLLAGGPEKQLEALSYARHFQPFARLHQREIQVMMGSLVYLRLGLEKSPYCHLLDNSHWAEICETFTRDACSLLGLSVESPLSVSFASGCVALPVLMNIKAVIEQRQCTGVWSHKDELPIEIELGMKCWYHSVFACPILRQQTSDSNPPIKLICGHVISRDALNKLINGGKLKCPYCPMEQNPADGKRIIF